MMTTTTTRMTRGAREHLRAYLEDVRRALAGSPDVDPNDVEAGIREHVEAELAARRAGAGEPATVEDVADVIARLGSPEAWRVAGAVEPTDAAEPATRAERAARDRALAAAFGSVAFGVALAFTGRWAGLGWLLLIGGSLGLRVLVPAGIDDAGIRPLERLASGWWFVFALVAALALLLGPGALVWGAAQIGGVLEPTLEARLGAADGARPMAYWLTMAAIAAFVTGVWWIVLGLIADRFAGGIRRALGTARRLVRPGLSRTLILGGAVLVVVSLAGVLL